MTTDSNSAKWGWLALAGVFLITAVPNSFYVLEAKEQAIIRRFGAYHETVSKPGINFKLPFIDDKFVADVSSIYRLEMGFRTTQEGGKGAASQGVTVEEEALMLTGDENLVLVETVIQYQVTSLKDFLFNVENAEGTLRIAADSTIHRVIASHTLDEVLTDNKLEIQEEMREDLQAIVDQYGLGVSIKSVQLLDVNPPSQVQEAFSDVTGAKEDKTASINKANAYSNEVIPKAKGKADALLNEAEAYYQERVKAAEGDVSEFTRVYEQYVKGKEVTRTRLYYEVMQEVLPNVKKYIMSNGDDVVKFLPLESMRESKEESAK